MASTGRNLHRRTLVTAAYTPIGHIETVFPSKFATPRQGSYSAASRARLRVAYLPGTNVQAKDALAGLCGFSHLWLLFCFHCVTAQPRKPKVQVPRLGGRRMGVFATRSPHRPNPIGLSLVRLDSVAGDVLSISGVDLVDGTPILDIKPYIPAYDTPPVEQVRIPDWIEGAGDPLCTVAFLPRALEDAKAVETSLCLLRTADELVQTVHDVLAADPRPAYRRLDDNGRYSFDCDAVRVSCMFRLVGRARTDFGADAGVENRGEFTVEKIAVRPKLPNSPQHD